MMVNCEWYERGVSCFMVLNSRLEIEFISSPPKNDGHVFFEPVQHRRLKARLDDNGRLVKYYKSPHFFSLMYDLNTVLVYGCGLTPVFSPDSSDPTGEQILHLVLGTLAVANRLCTDVYPICPRIAIFVPEGRGEILNLARKITHCTVVTTDRRKRACPLAYKFKELPLNLDKQACATWSVNDKLGRQYAFPDTFARNRGISTFAQLTALWPSVSKRRDVKNPACSNEPRWIGLMVCVAEWQGQRQLADSVAPGALESLRLSQINAKNRA